MNKTIRNNLANVYHYINGTITTILLTVLSVFRIRKNRILVVSYYGKGYGDNAKYIIENLLQNKKKYQIYWAVKNKKSVMPNGIKTVKYNSIKYHYILATSHVWINNTRFECGVRKRKKQYYIQTWHGGLPLKQIEKDIEDKLPRYYVAAAKNDSKMIDLLISTNSYMTDRFKKNFWYQGKILECGSPRNDLIVKNDPAIAKKVKKAYKLNSSKKICLYAPTFRNDGSILPYDINFDMLHQELKKRFGGEWVIFIRLHPNISDKSKELKMNREFIIDVTKYDDIQELISAADFMITDYSSCIFDYAINKKPCCIYASDIKEYRKDRNFYMSLSEYPFEIANNNEELETIIRRFDKETSRQNIDKFFKNIGLKEDGKGTETITNIIINKIEE